MTRPRGKILRIRPGLAGNFSGGYGYMPYVLLISAPLGFLGTLVSTAIVHAAVRRMKRQQDPMQAPVGRVDTVQLIQYAKTHLTACLRAAVVISIPLSVLGFSLLYSDAISWRLAAIIIGSGPLLLACLSTALFVRVIRVGWPTWSGYAIAVVVYVALLVGLVYLVLSFGE